MTSHTEKIAMFGQQFFKSDRPLTIHAMHVNKSAASKLYDDCKQSKTGTSTSVSVYIFSNEFHSIPTTPSDFHS